MLRVSGYPDTQGTQGTQGPRRRFLRLSTLGRLLAWGYLQIHARAGLHLLRRYRLGDCLCTDVCASKASTAPCSAALAVSLPRARGTRQLCPHGL
jgi:hypothetical protein